MLTGSRSVSVFSVVQILDVAAAETQQSAHSSGSKQTVALCNVGSRQLDRYGSLPAYGAVFLEPDALWSKCSCLRTISRTLSESFIGPSSAAS